MSVNGNQSLAANGGMGPYTWIKASGGGSLSGGSGTSVAYTAPSSNQNCANNPTIRLTDSCGRTNDLKLAVNASNNLDVAEEVKWTFSYPEPYCQWRVTDDRWNCDGSAFILNQACGGSSCIPGSCGEKDGGSCSDHVFNCEGCLVHWNPATGEQTCGPPCGAVSFCWGNVPSIAGWYDKRTPEQLAAGCCPALASACININSFSADKTHINLTSGETANLTAALQANGGGTASWTITVAGRVFTGSGTSISGSWDGKDASGKQVAAGNYTAQLFTRSTGGTCG